MLDLDAIDLELLSEALEDHSGERRWYLDRRSGEVITDLDDLARPDEEEDAFADDNRIWIDPIPGRESYGDLEDFVECVRDPRARELLERAIAGRGAFRRFKDTLLEFPKLRAGWFAFHDARMKRRALRWLADEHVVDADAAERAIAASPDPEPPELGRPFDARAIAERVSDDLRGLYGRRLRQVLLFGSWTRGDAHPESDIDLLVVLDRVPSPWDELRRMDDVLWRHSFANDTVVSALPVGEAELRHPTSPVLIRARAEGQKLA